VVELFLKNKKMVRELKVEQLFVKVYENRQLMGLEAAKQVAIYIKEQLNIYEHLNIVFAAAPSQNDFLTELCKITGIDWNRVNAFHMDEYIGLSDDAPQGFGNFLKEIIFSKLSFRSVNYLKDTVGNPELSCEMYAQILQDNPIDIVLMGIGENGHIAFNDPHVAIFNDPKMVKIVDLDHACRVQQVNDGCFTGLDLVPTHALTLTIPALLKAKRFFCVAPTELKSNAIKAAVFGPITDLCPASILRHHSAEVLLFTDIDGASKI